MIYANALNGAIQFKDSDSCPVTEYSNLLEVQDDSLQSAFEKYGKLPNGEFESKPCQISQCLFLGALKIMSELGAVKDEAEELFYSLNDDKVIHILEGDLAENAEKIKEEMNQTQVVAQLISEIHTCL